MGLGGLVHDIGMAMLPPDIEFKETWTAEEWKMIKEHPHLGYRMLEGVKSISSEVRRIVLEHHERPNGNGYPNNLHGPNIFTLAKIVAIADAFSEKIVLREHKGETIFAADALALMREEQGRFDEKMFGVFSNMFIKKAAGR